MATFGANDDYEPVPADENLCSITVGERRALYEQIKALSSQLAASQEDLAAATLEIEQWKANSRENKLIAELVERGRKGAEDKLAAFQRREAALREVLKTVEWVWNAGPPHHQYCAACGRWRDDGHNAVCRVRAALASPDPEKEPTP